MKRSEWHDSVGAGGEGPLKLMWTSLLPAKTVSKKVDRDRQWAEECKFNLGISQLTNCQTTVDPAAAKLQ